MQVISATRAKCIAPPNLINIESTFLEVALNNRDWSDDEVPYFYYKPARIINIIPQEGPTRGGTEVMIYGNEFTPGKKIICNFGPNQSRGKIVAMGAIKCITPKVDNAGTLPISISYEGEDSKFASESVPFLFYETPIIKSIEPTCGPFSGYTQLTVKGQNFHDMGFGKVKCIFNETITMNATIVSEDVLKCDTPKLNDEVFEPEY